MCKMKKDLCILNYDRLYSTKLPVFFVVIIVYYTNSYILSCKLPIYLMFNHALLFILQTFPLTSIEMQLFKKKGNIKYYSYCNSNHETRRLEQE